MSYTAQPHYQWVAKFVANVDFDIVRETTTKTSLGFGDLHPLQKGDSQQLQTSKFGDKINKNGVKKGGTLCLF